MKYDLTYFTLGAIWLVIGMTLGIGMGAAHNFQLMPVHAHINLIGFACHALFGAAHKLWPALGASALAAAQFWIFVVATPITLIGLTFTVLGGPEAPTIVGSLGLLIGALIFAVMIWRIRFSS